MVPGPYRELSIWNIIAELKVFGRKVCPEGVVGPLFLQRWVRVKVLTEGEA